MIKTAEASEIVGRPLSRTALSHIAGGESTNLQPVGASSSRR